MSKQITVRSVSSDDFPMEEKEFTRITTNMSNGWKSVVNAAKKKIAALTTERDLYRKALRKEILKRDNSECCIQKCDLICFKQGGEGSDECIELHLDAAREEK
jgi:hypothetical protein